MVFDHDHFYKEIQKRQERKQLLESLIFGTITFAIGLICVFLLLAIFNPTIYLCK